MMAKLAAVAQEGKGDQQHDDDEEHIHNPFLNINTCSLQQLLDVPHVGTAVAQQILEERIVHGQYTSWDDLQHRVKGVGAKKVSELKLRTFDVTPSLHGFLQDLNNLSLDVLIKGGVSAAAGEAVLLNRPFVELQDVKSRLEADIVAQLQEALLGHSWSPLEFIASLNASLERAGIPEAAASTSNKAAISSHINMGRLAAYHPDQLKPAGGTIGNTTKGHGDQCLSTLPPAHLGLLQAEPEAHHPHPSTSPTGAEEAAAPMATLGSTTPAPATPPAAAPKRRGRPPKPKLPTPATSAAALAQPSAGTDAQQADTASGCSVESNGAGNSGWNQQNQCSKHGIGEQQQQQQPQPQQGEEEEAAGEGTCSDAGGGPGHHDAEVLVAAPCVGSKGGDSSVANAADTPAAKPPQKRRGRPPKAKPSTDAAVAVVEAVGIGDATDSGLPGLLGKEDADDGFAAELHNQQQEQQQAGGGATGEQAAAEARANACSGASLLDKQDTAPAEEAVGAPGAPEEGHATAAAPVAKRRGRPPKVKPNLDAAAATSDAPAPEGVPLLPGAGVAAAAALEGRKKKAALPKKGTKQHTGGAESGIEAPGPAKDPGMPWVPADGFAAVDAFVELDGDAPAESLTKKPASGLAQKAGKLPGPAVKVNAVAEATGRWWESCTDECKDPPFPPEFRDAEVTSRWEYLYAHLALDEENPGAYLYNGCRVTAQQAAEMRIAWELKYPKTPQANEKGNGRETPQQRMRGTVTAEIRAFVWGQLDRLEAFQQIPKEWRNRFRVDAYGNVVADTAARKGSVCGFQVDHIFPWSRGGLTVKANVAAVHWAANEQVKRDHIINGNKGDILVRRMQAGLSVEQFLALVARREGLNRTAAKQFDHMLETLLCTPYSMPLNQLPQLEAGPRVWEFLKANYTAALTDFAPCDIGGSLDSYDG